MFSVGTSKSIEMKLLICDLAVMVNRCFKFQLDRTHGLAARIIYFFDNLWDFFVVVALIKADLAVPGWVREEE